MRQLLVMVVVCWGGCWATAQERDLPEDIAETEQTFRELIVAAAGDFDSPAQQQAIKIVQSRNYGDKSFNVPIRDAMKVDDDSDNVLRRVSFALELMPYSTLSDEEQTSLMLDVLMREHVRFETLSMNSDTAIDVKGFGPNLAVDVEKRIPTSDLIIRLDDRPDVLAKLLVNRFQEQEPSALLCALVVLSREYGADLLPTLIDLAKSDDPTIKVASMQAVHRVLEYVDKTRIKTARLGAEAIQAEEMAKLVEAGVDAKILKYAERIIARYDHNKDRSLTANEWEKMIQNPEPADLDGDAKITIGEYAKYLQARAQKPNR